MFPRGLSYSQSYVFNFTNVDRSVKAEAMLRDVRESSDMSEEGVGQVKNTAAIGKRVACTCIRFVDECDCIEVSVRKSTVA